MTQRERNKMKGQYKGMSEDDFWKSKRPAEPEPPVEDRIRRLVTEQPFAILCTQGAGQPYGSIVFFAFTENLKHAVFSTPKPTRKFRLLSECEKVALVVDNRSKYPDDMMMVEGITVTGRATMLDPGSEFDDFAGLLVKRHPYLKSFVSASSTAIFRIDVHRYIHVCRFQEVRQWTPPA